MILSPQQHPTHVSLSRPKIVFTTKNGTRKNWGSISGLLHHIKTHAMATHHGGTGHHSLDRGLGILTEDTEHADINNSTHTSDATVALGDPEAVGHPEDPMYNNQDRLTTLTREINNLHQRVAEGEG